MTTSHTLLHWFARLDRYGDRPAVIAMKKTEVQEQSYTELHRLTGRFATGLGRQGIGSQDRVAFLAPSSFAWMAACLGVIRAGAVPVLLDIQFDDDALIHVLDDSQPRLIVAGPQQAKRIKKLNLEAKPELLVLDGEGGEEHNWLDGAADATGDLPSAQPDNVAVLFYTSGTTGPPKGVPLTHENIAAQLDVLTAAEFLHDEDRVLLPLPLHHVYPFVVGMMTPLARGLPIVLPYALTGPQIIRALNEADVTIVIGVPRLYRALYDGITARAESAGRLASAAFRTAFGLSSRLRRYGGIQAGKWLFRPLHRRFGPQLRVVACGGSPLEEELAWKLEALGWQVAIGYGLTETSPLLTIKAPGDVKLGTVGRPIAAVDVKIDPVDEAPPAPGERQQEIGEILARGASVFSGYRNLAEKTAEKFTEDGWYRTGDLGFLDDDGNLCVTGRKGTMIVTESGENVQPDDIEDAYARHPAIREIGVLQDDGGLAGLIVPETREASGDLDEAIQQAVQSRSAKLPSYKQLNSFYLTRESLPRTRLGKIQRHKLRERFEQARTGEQATTPGPVPLEEMGSEDRSLLDDPAAGQTWELLAKKFSDRRLTPDASLRLDLGVDSLEWIDLSLSIRRRAGVEIDEEAIGRIETVRDLLEEAAQASAEGGRLAETTPLDDPEAVLSEEQQRHLKPHGRLAALASRGIYATNRLLLRWVFRLEVEGVENLPDSPIIIAPNHTSYLDPPAVAAALPADRLPTTYWGGWTGTLFANPLMRWFSRLTHVVPIDPQQGPMSSLAFGAAVLDRGHDLVWFPEGERSPDGELKPFRPGIGLLLESRAAQVVPTSIGGAYEAMPMGSWFPRPRKLRVTFGEPFDPETLRAAGAKEQDESESRRRIATTLHDAVADLMSGPVAAEQP